MFQKAVFQRAGLTKSVLTFCLVLAVAAGIATQFSSAAPVGQSALQKSLVVFVVRHAEKVASGRNPVLSETGQQRAKLLATTLRDANIDHVHSTDYQRTLLTAAHTADAQKLQIQKYNPAKLSDFARSMKQTGGRHLVVGHSNTTPELVQLLGGDPVSAIEEATEYDRLYVVTIGETGDCTSVLMRYGTVPTTAKAEAK